MEPRISYNLGTYLTPGGRSLRTSFDGIREWAGGHGSEPRFHGNGFVQLYMDSRTRLHVFHPGLPAKRVENAQIHDHRWDMESWVLLGVVVHVTYDVEFCEGGMLSVKVAPGASDKSKPLVEKPGSRCIARMTGANHFAAGSFYQFPARRFHRSDSHEVSMTLIRKGPDDGGPARILSPYGQVPDHAFEDQPPVDALWDAIKEAVDLHWETRI